MKKQNPTNQPSLNVMSESNAINNLQIKVHSPSVRAEPVLSLTKGREQSLPKGQFELVDLSLWENNKFVSPRSGQTHPCLPSLGGNYDLGRSSSSQSARKLFPNDGEKIQLKRTRDALTRTRPFPLWGGETRGGFQTQLLALVLLLGMFLPMPNTIHAQSVNLPQTKVILEGGASAQARKDMAGKVETILVGINAWHRGDASILESEPAGQQLISLISDAKLYSLYDTLAADVFTYGDEFEIPKMILRPEGGNLFDFEEMIFTLNSEYQLVAVRRANKSQSIDRILARDIEVESAEAAAGLAMLAKYESAFEGKSIEDLKALFSEDPIIVSGSRARNFDGFVLRRSNPADYFQRLDARTFVEGNVINITFTDASVRRHPDVAGFYGVTAKQDYRTSAYSDIGYIYFIADLSDADNPHIVYRQWQENPFRLSEFAIKTPDPVAMKLGLTAVEESEESLLEITLSESASEVLTSDRLAGYLSDGTLRFDGVTLDKTSITQSDQGQGVQVRFTTSNQALALPTGIVLRENNVLLGFEGAVTLYSGQRNIIGMSTLEEEVAFVEEDLSGQALVSLNVDSAMVRITSEAGTELVRQTQIEREASYDLMVGSYRLEALKRGYRDTTATFIVTAGRLAMVEIAMEELPPPPPPVVIAPEPVEEEKEPRAAFFTRKRLLYGVITALAVGAYFALSPDDPNYLPVPPGRPSPTTKR